LGWSTKDLGPFQGCSFLSILEALVEALPAVLFDRIEDIEAFTRVVGLFTGVLDSKSNDVIEVTCLVYGGNEGRHVVILHCLLPFDSPETFCDLMTLSLELELGRCAEC